MKIMWSTHEIPLDSILEGLYTMRILQSDQFKTIKQKSMSPSCQRFKTMEKHFWVEVESCIFLRPETNEP